MALKKIQHFQISWTTFDAFGEVLLTKASLT